MALANEASDDRPTSSRTLFGFVAAHDLDCTEDCPKGLNPAKAIAELKKLMVERRV